MLRIKQIIADEMSNMLARNNKNIVMHNLIAAGRTSATFRFRGDYYRVYTPLKRGSHLTGEVKIASLTTSDPDHTVSKTIQGTAQNEIFEWLCAEL